MLHALASSGFFAQESAQATPSAPQPPAEVLFDIGFMPVTNSILTGVVGLQVLSAADGPPAAYLLTQGRIVRVVLE